MSLVEDAQNVQASRKIKNAKKDRPKHPRGWEVGLDTEKQEIITALDHPLKVSEYQDAFTELLTEWGFDPALFAIEDDRVEVRTWNGLSNIKGPYGGELMKLWYYKAKIIRKRPEADIGALVKRIRSRKKIKRVERGGNRTFMVFNADWQLGKKDGRGTKFTITAVKNTIPVIRERYQQLRKNGHEIDTLLIANMGDLVEACTGHYPMQAFSTELSRREQVRLGRELLTEQILSWADDFDRVLVLAVPGNHGENRNEKGKTFTNLGDNDDVALVEQVAEAFDLVSTVGSRYEHVSFLIPDNELSFTLDVNGTIVAFAHGHAANTRPSAGRNLAHTKEWDWWYGQMMGRQPVADADMLITAHFHYLSLLRQGHRTAFQCPSLDDGSEWFVDMHGLESNAAIATMLIGGGTEMGQAGWSDLMVTNPDTVKAVV